MIDRIKSMRLDGVDYPVKPGATLDVGGRVRSRAPTRLVVIESPYAGDVAGNLTYLHSCIRECAYRGDSPYASHLMLTSALDDDVPAERKVGIALGMAWRKRADMRIFYIDREWSGGMRAARDVYDSDGLSYEIRILGSLLSVTALTHT